MPSCHDENDENKEEGMLLYGWEGLGYRLREMSKAGNW